MRSRQRCTAWQPMATQGRTGRLSAGAAVAVQLVDQPVSTAVGLISEPPQLCVQTATEGPNKGPNRFMSCCSLMRTCWAGQGRTAGHATVVTRWHCCQPAAACPIVTRCHCYTNGCAVPAFGTSRTAPRSPGQCQAPAGILQYTQHTGYSGYVLRVSSLTAHHEVEHPRGSRGTIVHICRYLDGAQTARCNASRQKMTRAGFGS